MIAKKNHIAISAKKDFLERLATTSSLNALAELIWNGLDAGANKVIVEYTTNKLGGLEEIRVADNGDGIKHAEVQILFGNLGDSWKKNRKRVHGRSLHGKNGQGRFKAFALGNVVTWKTAYRDDSAVYSYRIEGRSTELDSLTFTDPVKTKTGTYGTTVIVGDIQKTHGALLSDDAVHEFAKLFAAYLSQYPDVTIILCGKRIDPAALQDNKTDITLDPVPLNDGRKATASVTIVEWLTPTKRGIHLCDENGVSLHEIEAGVQAPGFNFTVYIKSSHFQELDKQNFLILDELHSDVQSIVSRGRDAVRGYFRRRLAERQREIVQRWKDEAIYPFVEKADLTPVEEAERQVFDILGVNLEAYLPKFDEADHNSRKFTFMLLAQALKENPKSVQKIITEVLNLKQEEQDTLAALLNETSLSNIISTARIVANRLDFLGGLENLLFDDNTKPRLLERDQLHKILATEAWIFDEEFTLSSSEERLEEVLRKHIGILGERKDGGTEVDVGEGKRGRIDLQLSRAITPRSGEKDYLIVELKRPTKKIDDEVITQVKKYANAIVNDERFHGVPSKWKFVAISNEMTEFARNDASQQGKPQGQVWISPNGQVTVWVREWAEVINTARARLQFINKSLDYEADRESAKEYLMKAHAKFIPHIEEGDKEMGVNTREDAEDATE